MIKGCLISLAVVLILSLGGCYYVFYHSSLPLKMTLGALEEQGVQYEGAEGSISTGFRLEKFSYPVSADKSKRSVFEGVEFTYDNIFSDSEEGELIIHMIAVKKCHLYVDRITDHVNVSSEGIKPSGGSINQGKPFMIKIEKAKLENCVIESLEDEAVIDFKLFEMDNFNFSDKGFSLDYLKLEDGFFKRKGQEDSVINHIVADTLNFMNGASKLKSFSSKCNSFNFKIEENDGEIDFDISLEPILHKNILKTIKIDGECQFIAKSNLEGYDLKLNANALGGEVTLHTDKHVQLILSGIQFQNYLQNITPLEDVNLKYHTLGGYLEGQFKIGEESFKLNSFDEQKGMIRTSTKDRKLELDILIKDNKVLYNFFSKKGLDIKDILAHCFYQKSLKEIESKDERERVEKLSWFFNKPNWK